MTQVAAPPAQRTAAPTRRRAKTRFRPDIEGLRAIAVGLVVLGHAGLPQVSGGYIGVDVFFVISGFLITSLLLRELSATGRISVAGFYARRAVRLLPMAAVVTAATVAAAWLWLPPARFSSIAGDALASSLYAVNYRLASEGTEYLNADAAPSPFQHFWSLAVEEQFYLLWPLVLLATAYLLRRRRELLRDGLAVALISIAAVTFALSAVMTAPDPVWSYFGLHTRGWELAAGSLIALGAAAWERMPRALAAALMWGGLAAIGWSALAFDESTVFPGTAAAVPVLGTAAVIAGGCAAPRLGAGALLGLAPLQILGRLSYGLYLWHWPVLLIGPAALGMEPTLRLNLVLAAAALGLTAFTFELIEHPVRSASWPKVRPRRGLGLGAALTALAAASAIAAGTVFAPQVTGTGAPVRPGTVDSVDALNDLVAASVASGATPSNLRPSPFEGKADLPPIYHDGCHTDVKTVQFNECVYGAESAGTRVVLFGDSHAASWFPALEHLALERGWELRPLTKSACSAPTIVKASAATGGRYHECEEWRELALDHIERLRPALVVVASSENTSPIPRVGQGADEAWIDGWATTLGRLEASGAEIVLPSNPPKFSANVPDCLSANLDDPAVCGGEPDALIRRADREREVLALAESMGVHTIDVTDWFCAEGFCPVIVGDMLAFRDSHHVSATYAEYLAPVLASQLRERGLLS